MRGSSSMACQALNKASARSLHCMQQSAGHDASGMAPPTASKRVLLVPLASVSRKDCARTATSVLQLVQEGVLAARTIPKVQVLQQRQQLLLEILHIWRQIWLRLWSCLWCCFGLLFQRIEASAQALGCWACC